MKTVAQLIKTLQTVADKSQVISLEGCDCSGEWNGKVVEWVGHDNVKHLELMRDHAS